MGLSNRCKGGGQDHWHASIAVNRRAQWQTSRTSYQQYSRLHWLMVVLHWRQLSHGSDYDGTTIVG